MNVSIPRRGGAWFRPRAQVQPTFVVYMSQSPEGAAPDFDTTAARGSATTSVLIHRRGGAWFRPGRGSPTEWIVKVSQSPEGAAPGFDEGSG